MFSAEIEISNDCRDGCEADGGALSQNLQTQLTKTQNFIEETKKQLEEMEKETSTEPKSSDIEPSSSVVESAETPDDYNYEDEDEEEYYDEFAPENHRYPFPMEYLIPVTER